MRQPYLLLGEIVRPQGIKGEVKIRHTSDDASRFLDLKTVYFREGDSYLPVKVRKARVQAEDVFLQLEGTDDRNAAEALRGRELWVDREHARPLNEDQVFIADIIGTKAYGTSGEEIGTLREVMPTGSVDVFVFDTPRGTLMLPALKKVLLTLTSEKIVLDEDALKEVGLYEDRRS